MKSIQVNNRQTITKHWAFSIAFLLSIIIVFLVLGDFLNALLALIGLFSWYFLSVFFWTKFIPILSAQKGEFNKLCFAMLRKHLLNDGVMLKVENGYLHKDYFALKNKPAIAGLLVGQNSAAITMNKQNQKQVYYSGFHQPKKDEEIVHTVSFQPVQFIWGPAGDQRPFSKPQSDPLNLNHIKTNAIAMGKTKCQSANGIMLAPVFSIYITTKLFKSSNHQKFLIEDLSNYFESKEIFGNLSFAVQERIGKFASNQFRTMMQNMVIEANDSNHQLSNGIFADISNRFDQSINSEISVLHPSDTFEGKIRSLFNIKIYLDKVWIE